MVVPEAIDVVFLKKFKRFILDWVKKRRRFIIVVGGGRLSRNYRDAAKDFRVLDEKELDVIGIKATHLNGYLIRSLFGRAAFKDLIINPTKRIRTEKKIIVVGGYKPGWSTDYVATLMAKTYKEKLIINASNIDYLYNKNPKKYKNARKIEKTTFSQLLEITDRKWSPGLNLPFDPVASRMAQKEKIKVIILNGRNFKNLDNLLKGKKFKGTIIEPLKNRATPDGNLLFI